MTNPQSLLAALPYQARLYDSRTGSGEAGGDPDAPKRLVVVLHGFGADMDDLIGLAPVLAPHLPGPSLWLSPNAPQTGMMGGRQWFPLMTLSQEERDEGAQLARPGLIDFLERALQASGLAWGDLILMGFSQGCMMALEAGLRLPQAPAGLVGFSGSLAGPQRLAAEIKVKPPVLLVHGTVDPIVPFKALDSAKRHLEQLEVPVETHACHGLAHGIDQEGLGRAALFMQALGS
jgi:phospholipase/carboxylesterase